MLRCVPVRSTLAAVAALVGGLAGAETPERFGRVSAWEASFEVRFDRDEAGRAYDRFEGTRSVTGTFRVTERSEDYGITWSGTGRAEVATTAGDTSAIEMDECFVSVLLDEATFSAKFGDVGVAYELEAGSSTRTRAGHVELITPELPLPETGLALSYRGALKVGRGEPVHVTFEIRPAS